MVRKMDSTQKHIILLKLVELYEHVPDFGEGPIKSMSKERHWLSSAGALLKRISIRHNDEYEDSMSSLSLSCDSTSHGSAIDLILGQIGDVIEELKLDLELDGRSEIGSVYEPGEVYRFYADLKAIISGAQFGIDIVDPYFNGDAFDDYLSSAQKKISIRILADRYTDEISKYVSKHIEQFQSKIELRKSREIHDRLLIIDKSDCWIVGQSFKDAAKKTTYLIPLPKAISKLKINIYSEIWKRSNKC